MGALGIGLRFFVALCACAMVIALAHLRQASAAGPPNAAADSTARVADATGSPAPGARAAALIAESTGQQLYGHSAGAELAIASTTKLMTALITMHHARLNEVFADPSYYPAAEDSQIGLLPGERMSVHDLLIAMLLPSADDAAEDLAYNVGGRSLPRFLGMMNARARELGLTHTHYTTPIGLDTPGNYSSAGDLVDLARYMLLTEPFLRSVVSTRSAMLRSGNHVRHVVNLNDLVARVPWINGVKTGHTLDAGYVLVVSGTQHGMTLIGAVLGASSEAVRDSAALSLMNYGFATFTLRTPVHAGSVVATRPERGGKPGAPARLVSVASYTHVFTRSTQLSTRVQAPAELVGPLPSHAVIGSVVVLAGGRPVARVPLELAAALPLIRHVKSKRAVIVVSVTLSGVLIAMVVVLGRARFWREWSRG